MDIIADGDECGLVQEIFVSLSKACPSVLEVSLVYFFCGRFLALKSYCNAQNEYHQVLQVEPKYLAGVIAY